ncbi:uncharacterized protein STEHIDRAFT_171492 [Stereum hirsutum FP-91666 SS1]|uniref:uncharacterized protein n=1 Tax=Stereum hirsutum (strain FP-91666) TaxID=721885 RepID=UPI0004449E31|nr:uncharacterized protein STEHIDRAFT_171492 [Stereum hirsutum FP-91666 SS1]EIM81842.1 hypothetical protein STEHIDRAFT_171492 [Stereum hirsutum FP-91666 SS1]
MRPLTLHASALNDDEYALFTSSLADLVAPDPAPTEHEKPLISTREVRAWLRGRYAELPLSELDAILQFFAPPPGQEAVLSAGQFFAILRLVIHVQSGDAVDRNMVFIQVHPSPSKSRPQSPFRAPANAFKRTTVNFHSRHASNSSDAPGPDTNPFTQLTSDQVHPAPPSHPDNQRPLIPVPSVPSSPKSSNPFVTRSRSIHTTTKPVASTSQTSIFAAEPSPSHVDRKLPPLPPRKPAPLIPPRTGSILSGAAKSAPLPPPAASHTTAQAHLKPPAPPPPASKVPHALSPLMKQSLQASRAGQNAKKAEAEREAARVLQVLKSSSATLTMNGHGHGRSGRSGSHSGSMSPPRVGGASGLRSSGSLGGSSSTSLSSSADEHRSPPPIPARKKSTVRRAGAYSPPPSSGDSTKSFDQVASASLPSLSESPFMPTTPNAARRTFTSPARSSKSPSRSPSYSPSRTTTDLPPPPPLHPDRKVSRIGVGVPVVSEESPVSPSDGSSPNSTPRMTRSKSMHQPSTPTLPPPRRKRPESVQYPPSSPLHPSFFAAPASAQPTSSTSPFPKLTRHMSTTSTTREREYGANGGGGGSDGPMSIASLREAFSGIGKDLGLDKARYKAEAGLSRRGYVPGTSVTQRPGGLFYEEGKQRLVDRDGRSGYKGRGGESGESLDGVGVDYDGDADVDADGGMDDDNPYGGIERDEMKWPAGDGWKPLR